MQTTSLIKKATILAAGVMLIAGVAVTPAQAAPIAPGLKIAIIPKAINNGYFTAWNKGAQKACKELKAVCDYMGPTTATGPAQVPFINTAIQKRYNAIVISAADQNAISPSLLKAQAKGIKVANLVEGGITPLCSAPQLAEMGFGLVVYPLSALYAATRDASPAKIAMLKEVNRWLMETKQADEAEPSDEEE